MEATFAKVPPPLDGLKSVSAKLAIALADTRRRF